MRWGTGILAVAAAAFALTACSPTGDCLCVAPTVLAGPATVTASAELKLDIGGLWTECCPQTTWPWDDGTPQPLNHADVTVEDGNGTVYAETTAEVEDDATAAVSLDLPGELPAYVWVVVNDVQIAGFWVD